MFAYTIILCFFFFNDTATTEIYTLSLHDALPISRSGATSRSSRSSSCRRPSTDTPPPACSRRSEEHTSELQSRLHLVCRLLLEKKKKKTNYITNTIKKIYKTTPSLQTHISS